MDDEIKMKIIESIKVMSEFQKMGANEAECIEAVVKSLNNDGYEEYKNEIQKKILLRKCCEEIRFCKMQFDVVTHKYASKLAQASGILALKGKLKSEYGYEYKFNKERLVVLKDGIEVERYNQFGLMQND